MWCLNLKQTSWQYHPILACSKTFFFSFFYSFCTYEHDTCDMYSNKKKKKKKTKKWKYWSIFNVALHIIQHNIHNMPTHIHNACIRIYIFQYTRLNWISGPSSYLISIIRNNFHVNWNKKKSSSTTNIIKYIFILSLSRVIYIYIFLLISFIWFFWKQNTYR